MKLKSCAILTVNHTLEVLMRLNEGKDWECSLKESIPLRKIKEGKGKD